MDKYNIDELDIPEWITIKFLEDVLRESEEGDNLKVTDFSILPATKIGDHYASLMFRINVNYLVSDKQKNISLILKTVPVKDGKKKDLVCGSSAFETEIKMYSEVIPKFHKILREIGDTTILGARMLYSSLDPIKIIIFEDLAKEGYKMIERKYLKAHEIDLVLEKICRWHAISFKLLKEGDESLTQFKEGVMLLEDMKDFFNHSMEGFSKLLIDQNVDPIYIEKFNKVTQRLIENCRNVYHLQGDLCVLNHGDFHANNMMIKMDENEKINALMLIDFQFCIAGPLIIDLQYLLYAVLGPEYREQYDEIIFKYQKLLSEILQKLGYKGKIPTVIDIREEMMSHKDYETFMIIGFLPFMVGLKDKLEIGDELMESKESFLSFYDRPSYINMAKNILPELLHKGYLD